jgi:1-pyrroline-5-carboxylate dehydrogenase
MSTLPSWATADPSVMGVSSDIHQVSNLVGGKWVDAKARMTIPDPMDKNSQPIFTLPDTQVDELAPFFESLRKVPKSGVHNPLKNPDRYVKYGEISRKVRDDGYKAGRFGVTF